MLCVLLPRPDAPPQERAEVYFLDAARAMVESGDWLVPRYEGQPFFDKPILGYWLMAAAMRELGPSAGAARLVPIAASLLVVLATVWLGTLLFERRSALAGAAALATSLAFLSFARMAMADMLLVLWTTLAVGLAVRAYRAPPSPWALPLLGAALGLGVATKGPIALLISGLALILVAAGRHGRPLLPAGKGSLLLGALAFLVLGFGWFALVYARLGPEPLRYFFLRENLERFAGEAYDVGRPFWFYLPAYLAQGLPWSAFLPIALLRLLRDGGDDATGRHSARLLAAWPALVLVMLSVSRGKVDYYLLPAYPPLSLLLGRYFVAWPWRKLDRIWARVVLLGAASCVTALLVRPPRLPQAWLPGPGAHRLAAALLVSGVLACCWAARRPRPLRVLGVLGATVAAGFLAVTAFFLPSFSAAQPNRAIAADVARERRYEPRARLAICSDSPRARRDVLFLARHAAVEQCDVWSLAASREPYLLLVSPAQDASLHALPRYRNVASYAYLPASTLTLSGLFSSPQPGRLVLCANFATSDPEAERKRKREYRKAIQHDLALEAAARARRP